MSELTVQNQPNTESVLALKEQQGQYLTFLLGPEKLAINIHEVNEIIEISKITQVPMTPDYIRGVINLRGNVVPVVDLCARLSDITSNLTKRSCIILVEITTGNDTQSVGMLVDQVNEILEIPSENIQPAPEFGAEIKVEFIQAMGRVEDEFIILLEVSRVLSASELSQLSQISNTEGEDSAE